MIWWRFPPTPTPPVCRVMDYGKFLYNASKKRQESKKKQKQITVKEIKFRPGTDVADYAIKLRNLTRFLEAGNKTKVTMRFRGREMAHKELGLKMLESVEQDLAEIAMVEQAATMEGRQMIMVLAPRRAVVSAVIAGREVCRARKTRKTRRKRRKQADARCGLRH